MFTERTFGPLAPITAVKDAYEDLAIVNESTCEILAGLINKAFEKALFSAENLESRTVYIDDVGNHDGCYYAFERCKENSPVWESARQYMQEMGKLKSMTFQNRKSRFPLNESFSKQHNASHLQICT